MPQKLNKIKAAPCEVTFWKINFAKISNFGKVCTSKRNTSELSEGNGEERKRAERDFGEKRL